jgi:predicted dehydrogenase
MSHFGSGPNLTRIYGSKSSILIDAFRPRAEVAGDLLEWKRPPRDPEDPMGFWRSTQVKAGIGPRPEWLAPEVPTRSDQSLFLDCLESGKQPEVSVFDGAKAVEALFAGYQSAAAGKVVRLPLAR